MTRTIRAGQSLAVGTLALALVLTGCGGGDPDPADTVTTADQVTAPETPADEAPTSTEGSDVHTRLTNALAEDVPLLARQIEAANPRIDELDLPETITGWQVFAIIREDAPSIPPAVVAIDDSDRAVLLTAQPASFAELTSAASITTAEQAVALAAAFLHLTRDTARLIYPISSFDDLRWADRLDADQVAAQEQARRDLASQVHEPRVDETAEGWVVISWSGEQDTIVRHETTVTREASVSDTATAMAEGLPLQRTVHG